MRAVLLPVAALLLLAAAARAGDPAPSPAPAPPPAEKPAPAPEAKPAPAPDAKPAPAFAKDPEAARAAARERNCRVLAVVTEEFYPSEPCRRLLAAVEEPAAREAMAAFAPVLVAEKEDLAFSKSLGLEDIGHPYTVLLDPDGKPAAWLRGAFGAEAWAKEVRRLSAAADAVAAARAAAEKAPADAKALFALSEALRGAGRVREADESLARAENADPGDAAGIRPLTAFRRLEARVEDRMAVQDFEGARALLDAYDREHPGSPRRRWVAFYRAVARAYRGEPEGALEDLREVAAAAAKDADLLALVNERVAALEKVIEKRK